MTSKDPEKWRKSMSEEIYCFTGNKFWVFVENPKNMKKSQNGLIQ